MKVTDEMVNAALAAWYPGEQRRLQRRLSAIWGRIAAAAELRSLTMSRGSAAVLRRAAELIAAPERWTQGTLARDANGKECQECGTQAVQWCALGAIVRAAADAGFHSHWCDASWVLRLHLGIRNTGEWNDSPFRTHAEVLAALRAAADAEERNG